LSDKVYLELAAQRYREAHGVDLLEDGQVRIVAGRGTKRFAPYFGLLQSLESQGIKFVVMLDGDEPGEVAAEAMRKFGAQKNRHYFHLERPDFKDKGGKSWEVEIEDMLAFRLIDAFVTQYPDAVEARFQMGPVTKIVINGKPVERDGQTYDFKMMLTEYVRQQATVDDLTELVNLLKKARKCMGLKE
jgi:predicted ATP-dependent endonuclease of OLD family